MNEIYKIFKNKNSITYTIVKNISIFLVIFMLSILFINNKLTTRNYQNMEKEKLETILNSIKLSLAVNISFEFKKAVEETMENLVKNNNIILAELLIFSDDEKYLFSNNKNKPKQLNDDNSFKKSVDILDQQTNKPIANISIYYSKDHFNKLLNEYYLWLSVVLLLYLITSIIFIRVIIKLIAPLNNIAHQMIIFDPANPKQIIKASTVDNEINTITISANKMINTILKYIDDINNSNKEIESKNKFIFEQSKMASMGEMIGNIAHQWRQPLSVISTAATGMKFQKEYNLLTDEMLNENCIIINNNAQYLSKTIDDFRNFIKGDRTKTIFSLKDNINSFLHLVDGTIKSNNINIILNLQEDIKIDGYENELTQCFINIFNNSKDVMKEKVENNRLIFISTSVNEDNIFIKFKDNAGGIPENIINKVFEPYFTTKHKSQGTGLGLHMTYNLIVDGMGGTIKANNISYMYKDTEYTGAEFTINLPMK